MLEVVSVLCCTLDKDSTFWVENSPIFLSISHIFYLSYFLSIFPPYSPHTLSSLCLKLPGRLKTWRIQIHCTIAIKFRFVNLGRNDSFDKTFGIHHFLLLHSCQTYFVFYNFIVSALNNANFCSYVLTGW